MGKKCVESFNPWPPFVDMFSSVILVLLLFMLILIVNIGYYAQFKFKISYTGSINTDKVILMEDVSKMQIDSEAIIQVDNTVQKEVQQKAAPIEEVKPEILEKQNDVAISAGIDMRKDSNLSRQDTVVLADYMTIKYSADEVILDSGTISIIKTFIEKAKKNIANPIVKVFVSEPTKHISATISKQLAVSRVINVRNTIRQLGFEKKDVQVMLRSNIPKDRIVVNDAGTVLISVEKKK